MSDLSRRQFFQFAGSALAALGFGQLDFRSSADRYGKVLAQSTSRKLALLVGVNTYTDLPLTGCVNDVALQYYLLVHRFGFAPEDIRVVTDAEATRQGILEAFEGHLIDRAKPGDVVVFHYSGHGSQVADPDPVAPNPDGSGVNGTFVPVDGSLPEGYPEVGGTVKDIMGHTLFLLMAALKTENVTVVLDSCFAGGATREDSRVRSRAGGSNLQISPAEKAYQQAWLARMDWTRDEFVERYRQSVAKGVVLAATSPTQLAREMSINGFDAGLFTYFLTEYLWRETATPESAMSYIRPQIPNVLRQTPLLEVKLGSGYETQPLYLLDPPTPRANAVVTAVEGEVAQLWLGGFDRASFETLGVGTEFVGVEGSGRVKLRSRAGLVAQATVEEALEPGTLLRRV
ncbi:MAG: caspase family protein [Cyanobacteriota bacterium]|nr:caspase family protein [Cyanobacteriota bacterium]